MKTVQQKHMAKLAKRKKHIKTLKRLVVEQKAHNHVRYREIPGLPGKYPYQLSPIHVADEYREGRTNRVATRIFKSKEIKAKREISRLIHAISINAKSAILIKGGETVHGS